MLGKVLTALLVMTAVLCCSAHMDFSNMTAEDIQKVKEMWSKSECKLDTNKTEDAIIANECIKTVTGKEPAVPITEENVHDPMTYQNITTDNLQRESIKSCCSKKHGFNNEGTKEEVHAFLNNKMKFTSDAARKDLGDRIDACIDENKGKEETAECKEKAFHEVCLKGTAADGSPK